MKLVYLYLFAAFCASTLHAADVPERFNYQGRLLDEDGQALGGSREAVFGVYASPAGGTALWEQKITIYADTNGLFNATLGDTTNSLVAAVGNQFGVLYLDMAFKVGGVMEPVRPRSQFVSVPYARLAENMAGAQSLEVSSNLTVKQKSTLNTLTANSAIMDNLKAARITAPKFSVSSIRPNTSSGSIVVRVDSPAVFHGFTPKAPVIFPPPSETDLYSDSVNSWRQATTDLWVNFSGYALDYDSNFILKMSPTRPDSAPSEYLATDTRIMTFSTVSGGGYQGLCIPVPAGWWYGYYASSGGYYGGAYPLSSRFQQPVISGIQGL